MPERCDWKIHEADLAIRKAELQLDRMMNWQKRGILAF